MVSVRAPFLSTYPCLAKLQVPEPVSRVSREEPAVLYLEQEYELPFCAHFPASSVKIASVGIDGGTRPREVTCTLSVRAPVTRFLTIFVIPLPDLFSIPYRTHHTPESTALTWKRVQNYKVDRLAELVAMRATDPDLWVTLRGAEDEHALRG